LLYIEVETHWCEGALTLNCRAPFSLLEKHTCEIDGVAKPAALRIPPDSTTRLLNSFKSATQADEVDESQRKGEEDGMDVDSQAQAQAGVSTDEQMDEDSGIQLYDGSKSPVRWPSPRYWPVSLKGPGLRLQLESNKHKYPCDRVSPYSHVELQ
jgi:hypothetical protein